MSEIITVIAQLSPLTFIITSMLAMGLSLTVKQIMDPLRNTRVVLLALLPKVTTTHDPRMRSNNRI
jgi:BASS family bile acid:Na+ symporter